MTQESSSNKESGLPHYTPAERLQLASRLVSDAELIKAGAEFAPLGNLVITPKQLDSITKNDTPKELLDKFDGSPQGQMLAEREESVHDFWSAVNCEIGNTAVFDVANLGIDKHIETDCAVFFGLDTSLLEAGREPRKDHLSDVANRISSTHWAFDETRAVLMRTPGLAFGAEISVLREGASEDTPENRQNGWVFAGIAVDGNLRVAHATDNELFFKTISATEAANNLVVAK